MELLQAMQAFARVAELGSFTRAADELALSRAMVSTHVRRTRARRGIRVRFSGTVRPARDGAQVAFQKRRGATWVTIGRPKAWA